MMDRALKESLDAASTQDADCVNEQRLLEMALKASLAASKTTKVHNNGPFIPSVSLNAASTLVILFSLKTMVVVPEWSCDPFSSDAIVSNETRIASVIAELSQR